MAGQAGPEAQDGRLSEPGLAALSALAERVQALALARGLSVGTAESCTGGLVGHALTSVAGSSGYYRGGVISYADALKTRLLGIAPELIVAHGAVSAQVAAAMAEGARERLGCDQAVAVTGVAGPGGGSADKPVGLTYVAVAGPGGRQVRRHQWHGDRAENKQRSAMAALELLSEALSAGHARG